MANESVTGAHLPLSPEEVEFLILYRQADADSKRRCDRLLDLARQGMLPPLSELGGPVGIDHFLDSLEVR